MQSDKQARGSQLSAARQANLKKQAVTQSDTALDTLWSNFNESKAHNKQLEHQLAEQMQLLADLQNDFNASQDLINTLRAEIVSLKFKNSDTYHQLRMEWQHCKRAISKQGSLASQILLLKKADAISSAQLSKGLRDSAATITKLSRINEALRTELSQSVTTWSSRTQIHSSLTKSNSLNILDFYYQYYHPNSERMKSITQGETPVINPNDNLEIVDADAHGNELTTPPIATATPLPIIWLTDDVKTKTITSSTQTSKRTLLTSQDIDAHCSSWNKSSSPYLA